MKILVAEDELAMMKFLKRGLSEEGYAVDVATTSEEASLAVAISEYDLILLDVMLPGSTGFELCERWRMDGLETPVLFLTARDSVRDRVTGLDSGGDDYLTKPFAFEELLARVRALIRRKVPQRRHHIITCDDIEIDTASHVVKRRNEEILLTAREYQLLSFLVQNSPKVVSRSVLWEHVWETGSEPDSNVVDVYIRYLRDKLGRDRELIQTVRGAGYRIATTEHR